MTVRYYTEDAEMPCQGQAWPRLAAICYRVGDHVDSLLRDVACSLHTQGTPVGGIVQRTEREKTCCQRDLLVEDLATGALSRISQNLGKNAEGCVLDLGALEDAAQAVRQAIADHVELLIINRFGGQEASGRGLRQELVRACEADIAVLTAVNVRYVPDWVSFAGELGVILDCERSAVARWLDFAIPKPQVANESFTARHQFG